MKELTHFKDPGNPKISVALAGINKLDWINICESKTIKDASQMMSAYKFDVLPIINKDNSYSHYYTTIRWSDYSTGNIIKKEIDASNTLYYLTSIEDAINKFDSSKSNYFFLDNLSETVGLITIGNLNCKHVYLYLYNLIIQLEHKMGSYIYHKDINDNELIKLFEDRENSINGKDALLRFNEDNKKGYDYAFIEYLYLTDLVYIFKNMGFLEHFNLTSSKLDKMIHRINAIRLVVAHPNKSLIVDDTSTTKLNNAIKNIDVLMNLMNHQI